MIKDFKGKVAVVTGGGSGIGRALVQAFVQEGASVALTDISQERVDAVVAEFDSSNAMVRGYRVDHGSEEESRAFSEAVLKDFGHVDVVCANAGIGAGGLFEEIDMDAWRKMIDVNLLGVVYTLNFLLPSMIARGQGGSLLITSSGAGLMPGPGMTSYHATKAAVSSLGQSLHAELAVHDIGVSVLCPGIIKTGITDKGALKLEMGDKGKGRDEAAEKNALDLYTKKGVTPDVVAAQALSGLKRNKIIIASPPSHILPGWFIHRLSPALFNRLVALPLWRKGKLINGVQVKN